MTNTIKKDIKVSKHEFRLEIYPALEGTEEITWEIYLMITMQLCMHLVTKKN